MKNTTSDVSARVRDILRRRFPHLSDQELEFSPGQEIELLRRIQELTGETRETIAIDLRSAGVNLPAPWTAGDGLARNVPHDNDPAHSRGSGIPDDTSRSGARSI